MQNSKIYTATSYTEMQKAVNGVINNDKEMPAITGTKELFTYNNAGKTVEMLDVSISAGLGGILAQGLSKETTISFIDNAFRDKNGVLSDVQNFNTWIREEEKTQKSSFSQLLYTKATRQIGNVVLTGNYELLASAPLDARMLTDTMETLVSPKWWITSFKRPVYLYNGLIVAVKSTKELYMYTGIDTCITGTDATSTRLMSIANWKRVSFKVDDVLNNPLLVLSHKEAEKHNGIQTQKNAGWKSDNVKYISSEKTLYGLGGTFATDYILLGTHHHINDYSVHRSIYNIYDRTDDFVGLSIIPNQPNKTWNSTSYKNKSEGVELQSVNSPLLLKQKNYTNDSLDVTNSVILSKEGISISAPNSTIKMNSKKLDLSPISYIAFKSINQETDYTKINTKYSTQIKSGMVSMEVTGGTYLSSGDETNIVAGAFAIHTTGYTVAEADNANSVLMNPVSFDYTTGLAGSRDAAKAQISNSNKVGTVSATYANKANNQETASTEFPGITLNSAANYAQKAGDTVVGFADSGANSGIVPPTTTANFNKTHNANLRITPAFIEKFENELTNGNIQVIDLSDTQALSNSKKVVYTDDTTFNEKLKETLSNSVAGGQTVNELSNNKLKFLNTTNELWINKKAVIDETATGNKVDYTKGYAISGATNTFKTNEIASLTELINNGTTTIESFGDISIYSNFGHVKLGKDGFVRMSRQKYFIVENNEDSYIRTTPNGIDIIYKGAEIADVNGITNNAGDSTKNITNGTQSKGYIHLDAGIISFWDNYILEKPHGKDQVLTFTGDDNDKALRWKTQTNVTGSINDTGVIANSAVFTKHEGVYQTPNPNGDGTISLDDWQAQLNKERNQKSGHFYKIGTFQYKGFNILKNDFKNRAGSLTIYENNVIQLNGEVSISLSCGAYSGDVNVSILVYKNGNARVTLNDSTIKYTDLTLINNTTAKIKSPLTFNHIPCTGTDSKGLIEFFVFVPVGMDCHWSVHSSKEDDTKQPGFSEWIHEKSVTQKSVYDKNDVSVYPYIDKYNETTSNFTIKEPEESSIEVVYTQPILLTGSADTNVSFANKVVEIPTNNTQRHNLTYANGKIEWLPEDSGTREGISYIANLAEVENINDESVPEKSYLMGAYSKATDVVYPTACKDNCTIHTNIYFDPAGDLHASNFYNVSDIRLKKDIEDIKANKKLPELKQFKFKANDELSYGFIAQEIEEAGFPELIHTDDDGYKRVNYISAYAVLFKLMQEEINKLKAEIKELKNN